MAPLAAQTAIRSPHFIFYSENAPLRLAEQGLNRLEQLRSVIQTLHGPDWVPSDTLRIWLPRNESEWIKIASKSTEQGLFLSGPRQDWIVANPAAPNLLEVLSHEYIHAVLHRTLPNLPTWFEEGICEFYSTLKVSNKGNQTSIVLGQAPGRRLFQLQNIDKVSITQLERGMTNIDSYALAWAAAFHLWPTYKPGQPFPASIPVGPFKTRTVPIDYSTPDSSRTTLTPVQLNELKIELQTRLPAASIQPDSATAEAESTFLKALKLSDAGQHLASLPLFEQACRLRPSNSTWWHAYTLAAIEAKDLTLARSIIGKALNTASNTSETQAAEALLRMLNTL